MVEPKNPFVQIAAALVTCDQCLSAIRAREFCPHLDSEGVGAKRPERAAWRLDIGAVAIEGKRLVDLARAECSTFDKSSGVSSGLVQCIPIARPPADKPNR